MLKTLSRNELLLLIVNKNLLVEKSIGSLTIHDQLLAHKTIKT